MLSLAANVEGGRRSYSCGTGQFSTVARHNVGTAGGVVELLFSCCWVSLKARKAFDEKTEACG